MMQGQYKALQFSTLIENLQNQLASGTFYVDAQINSEPKTRSRLLVWRKGEIIYGGINIPETENFVKQLVQRFKPDMGETAIRFAKEKTTNKKSVRESLEILVKMRVLQWEQIETFVRTQVLLTLEQVLPYPGNFKLDPAIQFDLCLNKDCHGLNWSQLQQEVTRRQQEWTALSPIIPSMDAVPHLAENGLEKITDQAVRLHLQQWVNGKRSLVDIAEKLDKEPLQIARSYLNWVQVGWVVFDSSSRATTTSSSPNITANQNQATILSVDDSAVVQATIKRALSDRYNVLLANNAVDALSLLNQKQVALLLLDVTMPDIDGLEMCRTVRSIPKFHNLPIIMLTAKDTLVDKMKGQIAGTNHYLTKPFDAEKLREVVSKYLKD